MKTKVIERQLNHAITAGELIEILSQFSPETRVLKEHTTGDHWRTKACDPVEDAEECNVEYTDYHQTLQRSKEEELDDENYYTAIIL